MHGVPDRGGVGAGLARRRFPYDCQDTARSVRVRRTRCPCVAQAPELLFHELHVARITLVVERVAVDLLFAEIEQGENERA